MRGKAGEEDKGKGTGAFVVWLEHLDLLEKSVETVEKRLSS